MIIPLDLEHVDQVAKLHCATLTGLLSKLGETAVQSFYAGSVKIGPDASRAPATCFVYIWEEEVCGFVFGSVHPDRLRREVVRNNMAGIFWGLLLGILRHPTSLVSLVKSFKGPEEGNYDQRAAELTYLAVSSECQGGGVGGRLVDTFTESMRKAGVTAYELSVDDDNVQGANFYEKLGFKLVGRYREFGIWHRRYRFQIGA